MASIAHGEAFLGLDYHSTSIQVCVLDGHGKVLGNRSVANDVAAVRAYVEQIRALLREERIESPADTATVWTKGWLKWLRETTALGSHSRWVMDQHLAGLERILAEVKAVEQRMEEATRDDRSVQQLLAEKGVGLVTAVHVPRRDRFVRPLPQRQAIGSVLRSHAEERLQRQTPGRLHAKE